MTELAEHKMVVTFIIGLHPAGTYSWVLIDGVPVRAQRCCTWKPCRNPVTHVVGQPTPNRRSKVRRRELCAEHVTRFEVVEGTVPNV